MKSKFKKLIVALAVSLIFAFLASLIFLKKIKQTENLTPEEYQQEVLDKER